MVTRERSTGGPEGGRSPNGGSPAAAAPSGPAISQKVSGAADPEVVAQATRRRFTAEYKRQVLAEADQCTAQGDLGALLRREGLYSSHLSTWRRQQAEGMLAGLTPKRRGRRPQESPLEKECHQLRRENERLRAKLRQAEIVIDVQKKVSEILGFPLATPDSTDET